MTALTGSLKNTFKKASKKILLQCLLYAEARWQYYWHLQLLYKPQSIRKEGEKMIKSVSLLVTSLSNIKK